MLRTKINLLIFSFCFSLDNEVAWQSWLTLSLLFCFYKVDTVALSIVELPCLMKNRGEGLKVVVARVWMDMEWGEELWILGGIDLGDGGCEKKGDDSGFASCCDSDWWLGFGEREGEWESLI